MSGTSSPHSGLTRRNFLKATGAAAGALGLAGAAGMVTADTWLAPTQAHAEAGERVGYTYHQSHCMGHCMLKCIVRDGRLCRIEPNDAARQDCQTVCVRGLAEIQHVYSDKRIQTPMKLVGERGSGEYEAISWSEAMDLFSKNINLCHERYGSNSVFLSATSECETKSDLFKIIGAVTGKTGIDLGIMNGLSPSGLQSLHSFDDWKSSDVLIISGANIMESELVHMKHFFDAKESGTYTICVDPHFCTTAGKCDEWIPIQPGTDAALYLGMVSCILDNEWFDREFILTHTSFPFLVSKADGSLLRGRIDPSNSDSEEVFQVWDEAVNALSGCGDAVQPALEGSFVIDEVEYVTVFSLLKDNQKNYSLAWASEQTGISENDLQRVAELYATSGAATLMTGYGGIDKYPHSDVVGHAMSLLPALTGKTGKPGCSVGQPYGVGYPNVSLPSWKTQTRIEVGALDVPVFELPYVQNEVRAFVSVGDQLQQRFADLNKAIEWAKTLDFYVYADISMGSTAKYADLILPICSKFECEGAVGGLKAQRGHIVLRQQIVEPLFESKTDFDFLRCVAQAFGVEKELPDSTEALVRWQLDNLDDARLSDVSFERLLENQGVWAVPGAHEASVSKTDYTFKTKSGRIEIYHEDMKKFGQSLPSYLPPEESAQDNPLRNKYPLQFATLRTRFRIHNQYADAKWIRQYLEAVVELNPVDMKNRALNDGDVVEVFNDRGRFVCQAQGNVSVRPGSARMYEGEWEDYLRGGNFQNVTNPTIIERGRSLPYGPVIPYNDTLVEVKKA